MANLGKTDDPWNPFSRGDAPNRRPEARKVAVSVIEPGMDAEAEGPPDYSRRRHDRVAGPFDGCRVGLLETPVRIYDLSLGGCFVNSLHEQKEGTIVTIKIDLPQEGWITVEAETVYRRPGFGFAVRFLNMDGETEVCLERTIAMLKERQATP